MTNQKPTESGWYWYTNDDIPAQPQRKFVFEVIKSSKCEALYTFDHNGDVLWLHDMNGTWGPRIKDEWIP